MRRGVGQFVKGGYGGSSAATKRFGGTAVVAGALYGALSPSASAAGSGGAGELDRTALASKSANDVMDAVVEAVRPVDGTQDAEASRASVKDALSELLTRFPDANLLELTDAQRLFAIERYVALDIFKRFCLDLGVTIQEKASSVSIAMSRLKEVSDYIKETVAAQFKNLPKGPLAATQVPALVSKALAETLAVFESYSK